MAERSTLSNGSALECPETETVRSFNGNGVPLVDDHVGSADHEKTKQRSLFCQFFSVYLKEECNRANVRPVPVFLGDGHLVDVYQLFSLVTEKGGYVEVSRKGLWDSVIVDLGLDLEFLAPMKLIYDKYLSGFEVWLSKTFKEKGLENGNHGCLKSLPLDLGEELQNLLCSNLNGNDDGNNGGKDNIAASSVEIPEKEFNSRKRKRESDQSVSGMLNWIRHTAKHPFDPVAQPIPEPSKWKEYKGGQDFFAQMLRARDVLLVKRDSEPSSGSSSQKVKMHPSMYEDPVAHHGAVKLRCSARLPSVKSHCPCCPPGTEHVEKLDAKPNVAKEKKKPTAEPDMVTEKKKSSAKPHKVKGKKKSESSKDDFRDKYVSAGPLFQAEVPEWTGAVYDSDSKWLGEQVGPVKGDSKPTTETDLVWRRRQENCNCNVQGSVDCVRFHIAENRMKLKLELGSTFFHWGFDKMGEEVSLRWTADEEKKFKDAMKSNFPSQNKSFWNNPSKYFLKKTRKDMVSYYFNAYITQLRSYQNRVTPKAVDSDDDEVEFGSFGDGFGRNALKNPSMEFMECQKNKQCFDFE